MSVSSPALWSLDAPHLYRAEVELVSGGFYGAVCAVKPFMEYAIAFCFNTNLCFQDQLFISALVCRRIFSMLTSERRRLTCLSDP
ncbi:MAG: hypothetical protein ACRD19_14835 [Terriglobia bacterium]